MKPERAQASDVEALSLLFADAFMEDPVWSAIVPKEKLRHRVIRNGFRAELKKGDFRNVDVVRDEDGNPLGALHFAPPEDLSAPSGLPLTNGAASFNGPDSPSEPTSTNGKETSTLMGRLVKTLSTKLSASARRGIKHDEAVHAHRPQETHWYFRDLVTSKEARGRGIGSKLFRDRLQIVDENPMPVFLESTSEASKRLYERFGFEHVATVSELEDCAAYVMIRPATDPVQENDSAQEKDSPVENNPAEGKRPREEKAQNAAHGISAGDYSATIVSEGAGLASLTCRGRDLVLPHEPNRTPEGYSGKVLVPWPNRVAGAKYEWEGELLKLPVTEPERGAALHGLQAFADWNVTEATGSSVTLETEITPSTGYPFHLSVEATYVLDSNEGLTVTITARNVGDQPAPYGASIHPYLTCGVPVEQCVLTVPASAVVVTDELLTPVGVVSVEAFPIEADLTEAGRAEGVLDFRTSKPLLGRQLDDAFTGLPEGTWKVTVADPTSGRGVELRSDTRWVQVFAGEELGKQGVAVEPMTCPADAFNSGTGLIVLQPNEQTAFTASISSL